MRSFLKKSVLNIVIWLLIFPMTTLSSDEFIVKDIKIEGLEKISEGALTVFRELLRSAKPGTSFTLESIVVIEKHLKSKGGGEGAKHLEFSFPIDPTGNLKESTQEEYVLHNQSKSVEKKNKKPHASSRWVLKIV